MLLVNGPKLRMQNLGIDPASVYEHVEHCREGRVPHAEPVEQRVVDVHHEGGNTAPLRHWDAKIIAEEHMRLWRELARTIGRNRHEPVIALDAHRAEVVDAARRQPMLTNVPGWEQNSNRSETRTLIWLVTDGTRADFPAPPPPRRRRGYGRQVASGLRVVPLLAAFCNPDRVK